VAKFHQIVIATLNVSFLRLINYRLLLEATMAVPKE